jgi:hypothetical protein
MSFATIGVSIEVGSFSMGGSTLMKVCAVNFGEYLISKNQLTIPQPRPKNAKKTIINQCLRSIANASLGVI